MIVCRDKWRQVVDYLTVTIVSPGKLFLPQLTHLTPELLIRNLPNRRAMCHLVNVSTTAVVAVSANSVTSLIHMSGIL